MADEKQLLAEAQFKDFDIALQESQLFPLRATGVDVLQINFGMLCNQSCKHCHVQAGPTRKERISKDTLEFCLDILKNTNIQTL